MPPIVYENGLGPAVCAEFNGHIGNGEQRIKGNKEEINVNGRSQGKWSG